MPAIHQQPRIILDGREAVCLDRADCFVTGLEHSLQRSTIQRRWPSMVRDNGTSPANCILDTHVVLQAIDRAELVRL